MKSNIDDVKRHFSTRGWKHYRNSSDCKEWPQFRTAREDIYWRAADNNPDVILSHNLRFDSDDWDTLFTDSDLALADLAVNGDVNNVSDYLLKMCNGAKIRGREVESIEITSAVLYSEYSHKREQEEYVLYVHALFDLKPVIE